MSLSYTKKLYSKKVMQGQGLRTDKISYLATLRRQYSESRPTVYTTDTVEDGVPTVACKTRRR